MICTRCDGTGILNYHQLPGAILLLLDLGSHSKVLEWIDANREETDASVCDCCGDKEKWYGVPGEHYAGPDVQGPEGPYAYNGGLPECS